VSSAATGFELLPAIDLRGGRVVRLREGDFARETAYGDDPVAVARAFVTAGAEAIHLVDLDGARAGRPVQLGAFARVVQAVGPAVGCEVAGGLRTEADVAAALAAGATRTVVGTAALRDPAMVGRLVGRHGAARVVVALDVRDGLAVGEGWRRRAAGRSVAPVLRGLYAVGVRTFEVTAIARDGGLAGPDLELVRALVTVTDARIVASGGIRSVDDLRALRSAGAGGAIVGRALYEGRLDLAAAIAALRAG